MAESSQGLCLYLADTLPSYAKLSPHLFQGAAAAVLQAEAQLEDAALPDVEGVQNVLNQLLQELVGGGVRRRNGAPVLYEVPQVVVLLLALWGSPETPVPGRS